MIDKPKIKTPIASAPPKKEALPKLEGLSMKEQMSKLGLLGEDDDI